MAGVQNLCIVRREIPSNFPLMCIVVGAFKPHLKNIISSKWVHLPQGSGWTSKNIWSCHHLGIVWFPPKKKRVKNRVVFQLSRRWKRGLWRWQLCEADGSAKSSDQGQQWQHAPPGSWQPPGGGKPTNHCWLMATRNSANWKAVEVKVVNIPWFTRVLYTCQVVVWDVFHQQ